MQVSLGRRLAVNGDIKRERIDIGNEVKGIVT